MGAGALPARSDRAAPQAFQLGRVSCCWGHGAIVALSITQGWWQLPLLITLAPFYGGGFQFLLNEAQHIGLADEVDDYRLNTRTLLLNPVLGFFVLADELSHRASHVRGCALL